jgi:hypothetical protein
MAETINFGIRLTADGNAFVGTVQIAREQIERLGAASRQASGGVGQLDTSMRQSMTSAVALGSAIGNVAVDVAKGFTRWMTAGYAAANQLKDLSDITGSTVESLSQLTNIARVSGTSAAGLETALSKLAVGLSGTDEESRQAGKALAALGIQSRDPAQAMTELAKKFAQYADDANKAAYANEIFGRGGAKLLPLLKDIAEQQDVAATVTARQAQEAERLGENMRRLSVETDALRDSLLSGLLPQLNNLLEQLREGTRIAGGFWQALNLFSTLPAVNNIAEAQAVIEQINANLLDSESKYESAFGRWVNSLLGNSLEKAKANAAAKIEFIKLQITQLRKLATGQDTEFGDLEGAMARAAAKPSLGAPPTGAKGKKEVDDFARALEQVRKVAAEAELELAGLFDTERITKASRALTALMASDAWPKFTKQQQETLKAILGQASAVEQATGEWERLAKAAAGFAAQQADERRKWEDVLAKNTEDVDKLVATLDLETKTMFQTNEERERAIALSEILWQGEEDYLAKVEKVNAAFDRRNSAAALKKSLDEQQAAYERTYNQIADSLTDALLRGFESGKDIAQNFIDTLKNMFGSLVLRPIIQAIVSPLAGGITSMLGFSGAAQAAGGGGGLGGLLNLGGTLGNLGNWAAGGGIFGAGLGNTFALSGVGQTLGLSAAGLDMAGGVALTGLGTTLGTVIPLVGAGLAIASMFGAFSKGGGPKQGGSAGYGGFYPGETTAQGNAAMQAAVADTSKSYSALLKLLGGSGAADFTLGFDTDPQGTAGSRVSAGATVGGKAVYSLRDLDVGRDPAALEAALKSESKKAILAALQASDLPDAVAAVLQTVNVASASDEAIDNLLNFATAMGAVLEAISGDVVADAQVAWEESQRSTIEVLRGMGQEVIRLAENLDGSAESMQALSGATIEYRQAVDATLIQIRQIAAALKETFAATREQVEFAGLGKQESYDLYRQKGSTLLGLINESDDPAMVQKYAEKINGYFLAAFNLLSPEEQLANKATFLADLDAVDTAVSTKLGKIATLIGTDTTGPFAAVQKALDSVAAKMQSAADTSKEASDGMKEAANTALAAARTPQRIEVVLTGSAASQVYAPIGA